MWQVVSLVGGFVLHLAFSNMGAVSSFFHLHVPFSALTVPAFAHEGEIIRSLDQSPQAWTPRKPGIWEFPDQFVSLTTLAHGWFVKSEPMV